MIELPITGRCYCGNVVFSASAEPQAVAYCHCDDCKRSSGAPVAAFAAFDVSAVTFSPDGSKAFRPSDAVTRNFCETCGSSLWARYDYLPDQVYVPLGLIDQATDLEPEVHAYDSQRLPWLHIQDSAQRFTKSSQSLLRSSRNSTTETVQ